MSRYSRVVVGDTLGSGAGVDGVAVNTLGRLTSVGELGFVALEKMSLS